MSLFSLFFVAVQKLHSKLFLCKKINLKYERLLTLKVQLGFFMQKLLAQRDLTSNKLTLRLILHTCLLQCNMYPLKMSKLNVSHHFNLILNAVQGFVLQSHMYVVQTYVSIKRTFYWSSKLFITHISKTLCENTVLFCDKNLDSLSQI